MVKVKGNHIAPLEVLHDAVTVELTAYKTAVVFQIILFLVR